MPLNIKGSAFHLVRYTQQPESLDAPKHRRASKRASIGLPILTATVINRPEVASIGPGPAGIAATSAVAAGNSFSIRPVTCPSAPCSRRPDRGRRKRIAAERLDRIPRGLGDTVAGWRFFRSVMVCGGYMSPREDIAPRTGAERSVARQHNSRSFIIQGVVGVIRERWVLLFDLLCRRREFER